jgi:hypothetical protein
VTLSAPPYVYGDNMSVDHNTHQQDYVLKKKSNYICHHAVRECQVGRSVIT